MTTDRRPGLRAALAPLALGALAACDPTTMPLMGDRAEARDAAVDLVAARDPVITPEPVAQCIGASATREEAETLVTAARGGDRPAAQAALDTILRKSSTQECLARVGVPDFL